MNRREKTVRICFYILIAAALGLPLSGTTGPWSGAGFSVEAGLTGSAWSDHKTGNPLEILGFYTGDEPGLSGSYSVLENHSENLTYIAPFYFRVSLNGGGIEKMQGIGDRDIRKLVEDAHGRDVQVMALVHNLLYGRPASEEAGKKTAHAVLADSAAREKFIEDMFKLVKKYDFDGINLDIEDIFPGDRDNMSALVRETKERFSSEGLLVTVCVPPESGDFVEGSWAVNFDYPEIGRWADRVVIMTYDEHGYSTGPGPVASVSWVQKVIRYSVSVIPSDKILLGIPAYGFDWTVDKPKPRYLSFKLASETAERAGIIPGFDNRGKVPYFEYKDGAEEHRVWYEDEKSFRAKAELASKWGLGGLAIWRLGMEDPAVWEYIDGDIEVQKLK